MILQVVTDTDRRGAQVFASDLDVALTARGRTVLTVALSAGLNQEQLDIPHLGHSRLGPSTLRALHREIQSADTVIGHGSTTLMACGIASVGTKSRFVYRQISDSLYWAPTTTRRLRVRAGLRRADTVVCLWSGAARTMEQRFGVSRSKLEIIPNGVPAARFPIESQATRSEARKRLDIPEEVPVVLYLGALVPEKGVDMAIEAVALLPEALLIIVGDGPMRPSLEELAQVRAPHRVRFIGSLSSPHDAYAAADVLALPSRGGDSMPAVLIEASLSGVPAVATPIQAIAEVVLDGTTGRLVKPDDPQALARGLREVISKRAFYSAAARKHCLDRFEIGIVAKAWDELLSHTGG